MKRKYIANVQREYDVHRVVHHVGRGDNVKYVVRLYGSTSADNLVEQQAQIPELLITHYWRQLWKHNAMTQRQREANRGQKLTHTTFGTDEQVNDDISTKRK